MMMSLQLKPVYVALLGAMSMLAASSVQATNPTTLTLNLLNGENKTIDGVNIDMSESTASNRWYQLLNGATLNIGTAKTETIKIENTGTTEGNNPTAFFVTVNPTTQPGSKLNIQASKSIEMKGTNTHMLWIQSNTETPELGPNSCSVSIKAPSVLIETAKKAPIIVFSNSSLEIEGDFIKIARTNGTVAIDTRGNSQIKINADGKGTVQIDGNITFTSPADKPEEHIGNGKTINSNVILNLTGPDSYWTGQTVKAHAYGDSSFDNVTDFEAIEPFGDANGFQINITDGAAWNVTGFSYAANVNVSNGGKVNILKTTNLVRGEKPVNIANLNLNNGIINVEGDQGLKIEARNVQGQGTVNVQGEVTQDGKFNTAEVTLKGNDQASSKVDIVLDVNSDNLMDPAATLVSTNKINVTNITARKVIPEAGVTGAIVQDIQADGTTSEVREEKNKKLDAYSSLYSLGAIHWRHENDSLLERMGDLRNVKETLGGWARVYGSEQLYGDQNLKAQNTTIQVGLDGDVGAGWRVGGAFAYTDGKTSFANGEGNGEMYGLSVYGTWLGENGQFVDLIAKASRLSNDFKAGKMAGDYDNNALSVTAEVGQHFALNDVAFVEPTVGVTYGRLFGDEFTTTNKVKVVQEDYDTLVGRLGLRSGFYFPNHKGTIYARAAVLHDFLGDAESTASKPNDFGEVKTAHLKDELGGTWVEYGLGANFYLSDVSHAYVDLERTNSAEITEKWRWTVGFKTFF